jgi:hypothetical protein
MDTIPRQIASDYKELFTKLLPGWSVDGKYNFQPGGANQKVAAQLGLLMHSGSHPWINNGFDNLLLGGQKFSTETA